MCISASKRSQHQLSQIIALFFMLILAGDLSANAWKGDLEYFRAEVFEADQSFSDDERISAEAMLARLESAYTELSDAEIELALAGIMAQTKNGHSFLMPGGWTTRYARLPVSFRVFDDGIFVMHANPDHEALVGKKLVSIDGVPVDQLKAAWNRYQGGGTEGWRNEYLPHFLEAPEILHAAGLVESPDSLLLVLADEQGKPSEHPLAPNRDQPPLKGMDLFLAPPRLLIDSAQASEDSLPVYLRDPGLAFRYEQIDALDADYVQFKANSDFSGQQDIDAFLDSISGKLRSSNKSNIVLDQRFNVGGDLNITRDLMTKLPEYLKPTGKLFIITSGRTFSAGISSVGYARQAAGEQAVIVGEPPGDELEFWAEGNLKILPDSGVAFLFATERHNYVSGCPEPDCHSNIRRHPIRVDTLDPDLPAPLTYAEYKSGVDPSIQAIGHYLISQRN